MIYTRFGTPVKILTAELDGDTLWVTAEQAAKSRTIEGGYIGRPILDGEAFHAAELRADNGWSEILDACKAARDACWEAFLKPRLGASAP
jgi:hypothetical protein